jgi:hypothetical protein
LVPSGDNVMGHTPSRVVGAMQKPHRGSKTARAGETRKIQAGDRGFEVRRENGLLLGAQPRFQVLTEERQTLEVEPVSRSGDDMIGRNIHDLSIRPGKLQQGAIAPNLGPPHEMTEEGRHAQRLRLAILRFSTDVFGTLSTTDSEIKSGSVNPTSFFPRFPCGISVLSSI